MEGHGLCPHLYVDDTGVCGSVIRLQCWSFRTASLPALMMWPGGCAPISSSLILQRLRFSGLHPVDACLYYTSVTNPSGLWPSHVSFRRLQPRHLLGRWCVNEVACLKDCCCLFRNSASTAELSSLSSALRSTVTGSSLVLQRLDYGNKTLAVIPFHLTKQMQSMLNSAAQLVFSASRYVRITPLLTQLHWLRCRCASSLSWLFWYTDAYTRQLHHTLLRNFISHLLTRLISISALHRYHRLLSDAPVFQPSAIELFRSLLPDCGILCRWTSRRHRQCLFSGNIWRPISSVILSQISCMCLCSDFVISDTIVDLFTYFLTYLLTVYVGDRYSVTWL